MQKNETDIVGKRNQSNGHHYTPVKVHHLKNLFLLLVGKEKVLVTVRYNSRPPTKCVVLNQSHNQLRCLKPSTCHSNYVIPSTHLTVTLTKYACG